VLIPSAGINENVISFLEEDSLYLAHVLVFCVGRSLFKTTEGHIGLAPKEAKPGDLVTALFGCNSAMILRPVQAGKYLVVGEAFCSGVINGEAFLGPIPGSFDVLYQYTERQKAYYWAFIDRDSGKFQVEDPRLVDVPLPAGWRRREHENEEFEDWFVNDETGEDNNTFDPRGSPEALKSRGVKLEAFDLV